MDGPFSENLGEGIFQPSDKDEIVLCLNYDGKFGLNNLNTYFQNANTAGEPVKWAEWTYKVGDKILFIDNHISSLLYNNLKGQIIKIEKEKKKISFTLDIFARYSYNQCRYEKFKYVKLELKYQILKMMIAFPGLYKLMLMLLRKRYNGPVTNT